MKYRVEGKIRVGENERKFEKEVDGNSKRHALDKVYSLFGSHNRLKRTRIKIEKIEEIA